MPLSGKAADSSHDITISKACMPKSANAKEGSSRFIFFSIGGSFFTFQYSIITLHFSFFSSTRSE
jgi:hypothetical protein